MEIVEKVKEIEKEPTKEYASKGIAGTALDYRVCHSILVYG